MMAMTAAISSPAISSSWLVSVDFDGNEAIVTWFDGDDVEHTTRVEILTERRGYGRRVRFSCEVDGDVPTEIAYAVAAQAEERAECDYWGV